MKKIIISNGIESENIYFDFENDFPQLGCEYIEQTCGNPATDVDADSDEIERVEALIESSHHEECDERDYEYVRGLVEAWGL